MWWSALITHVLRVWMRTHAQYMGPTCYLPQNIIKITNAIHLACKLSVEKEKKWWQKRLCQRMTKYTKNIYIPFTVHAYYSAHTDKSCLSYLFQTSLIMSTEFIGLPSLLQFLLTPEAYSFILNRKPMANLLFSSSQTSFSASKAKSSHALAVWCSLLVIYSIDLCSWRIICVESMQVRNSSFIFN